MPKRALKYGIAGLAFLLLAYHSVYFKKLDAVRAERAAATFDPTAYARNFWDHKLIPNLSTAVSIDTLIAALNTDPEKAFDTWSHALGIGNLRYFLVRGKGTVTAVDEDDITLSLAGSDRRLKIATGFIFGNAVRDASGMVDINDFNNTMDFNSVSAEINKIIRSRVLPILRPARPGNTVDFTSAIELNKAHLNLSSVEAIPVEVVVK